MPQPTAGDVHISRPLTDLSVAYLQDQAMFIADKVFPIVPVTHQANQYFVYDKEDWFRIEAKPRAAGTASAGSGWELSTDAYACLRDSLHKDVDDETAANADPAINIDRDAMEYVMQQLWLKRETDFFTTFFGSGIWSTDVPAGSLVGGKWDTATGDPIADVRAQASAIQSLTGRRGNVFSCTQPVWDVIADNPNFIDRIKYTQRGVTSPELFAEAAGIDEVVVGGAVRNTAAEGATEATDFFANDGALLTHRPASPGLYTPSAGYHFAWTGFTGASSLGTRVKRFRIEEIESWRVEGDLYVDQKQVAPDLGVFFEDVLGS